MQLKFLLAALILVLPASILTVLAEESNGDGDRIAKAKHVKVYAESGRFVWSAFFVAMEWWP